jgi:hypothetical protein
MGDTTPAKKRRRQTAPAVSVTPTGTWSRGGAVTAVDNTEVHEALWVFLMFDELDKTRNTTSIHISKIPASAVAQFNSGKRDHRKNSKYVVRDWKLEQWIGPFKSREEARMFANRWARSQCALYTRVMRGAELARDHKPMSLDVFSFHKQRLIEALTPAAEDVK